LKSKDSIQEIDSPTSSSSSSSLIQHNHLTQQQQQQPQYYTNNNHYQHHAAHFVSPPPYLVYENNQESISSTNSNSKSNNKTRLNNSQYYSSGNGTIYNIPNNGGPLRVNNKNTDVKQLLLPSNRKYPNATVTATSSSSKNIPINIENLNYNNNIATNSSNKKLYLNNNNNKLPVYNYHHHHHTHHNQPQAYNFNSSRPLSGNNSNRSNIPSHASVAVASVNYINNNKHLKQKHLNSQASNLGYIHNYTNNSSQYYNDYSNPHNFHHPHHHPNHQININTYQTNYGKSLPYANNRIDMETRLRHRGDDDVAVDNVSPSSLDYDALIMVDEINLAGGVVGGKTLIYNDNSNMREAVEEEVEVEEGGEEGGEEEEEEEEDEEAEEKENEEGDVFIELNKNIEFYISLLSSIKEPIVCDIEAKSSLVRLSPIEAESFFTSKSISENKVERSPSTNDDSNEDDGLQKCETTTTTPPNPELIIKILENLNYTLELSSESNKFNKVYTGDANEITLKDLKPNTKYFLRYEL